MLASEAWAAEREGGSLRPRVPFWEGLPRNRVQKQTCGVGVLLGVT